jgi:hypothetical protein
LNPSTLGDKYWRETVVAATDGENSVAHCIAAIEGDRRVEAED